MASPTRSPTQLQPGVPHPTEDKLRKKFKNFDDADVYAQVMDHGLNEHARNFVVQFGPKKAEIAMDLDVNEIALYMHEDHLREGDVPIRWINIWNPGTQMKTVKYLGKRYGFSNRLTMSIVLWDIMKAKMNKVPEQGPRPSRSSFSRKRDVEQGMNGEAQFSENKLAAEALKEMITFEDAATFRLMQSSLNYTSIDPDQHFICLGANWLHQRPHSQTKSSERTRKSLVPPKHWSWFAICDKNTVISFHEAAAYETTEMPEGEDPAKRRQEELIEMRSNTLKVLKQLSVQVEKQRVKIPFTQLSNVRFSLGSLKDAEMIGVEGSSNLFYYLFEDYSAAIDIVNTSKFTLDRARKLVYSEHRQHDTKGIVNDLYTLKRELSQLRQLFASYKTLIERLLAEFDVNGKAKGDDARGQLSKKARDRFERLKDRIQSLMLDAIQESLGEQQSLQETWFNLTRERDSRATARLTRSATLLAKLSVLFLPVTFMTSYFSVEIPGLMDGYTPRTYWVAFAVIASGSFVALFFFGRVLEMLTDGIEELTERGRRWITARVTWWPGSRREREARAEREREAEELDEWR